MQLYKLKLTKNSISTKLIALIIITLFPMILSLIFINIQMRDLFLTETKNTHSRVLESLVQQLDTQLYNAMNYTNNLSLFDSAPYIISSSEDEAEVAYAKQRIQIDFSKQVYQTNLVHTYFFYSAKDSQFIYKNAVSISKDNTEQLQNLVEQLFTPNSMAENYIWNYYEDENTTLLFQFAFGDDNYLVGSYVNLDIYLHNLASEDSGVYSIIRTDDLEHFIQSNENEIAFASSDLSGITLAEILNANAILSSLPFMQKYVVLISVVLFVMLFAFIYAISILVIKPLSVLTSVIRNIKSGDLDTRIPKQKTSAEFQTVNSSFNEMIDNIENLKINVYEEQINVQKSSLRNLQLQIKPHFLINTLNMIYNFILNKKEQTALDLIRFSSDYFRFLLKVDADFVSLKEEIKYMVSYLEIQKIRYQDCFTYSINIDSLIEETQILPMLIQNFVENAIKYALSPGNTIHISLDIKYYEVDFTPYIKINISDTGKGFPPDILDKLANNQKIINETGEHIGIYNSIQRIKIAYNDTASWKFSNNSGAACELILPAIF